MFGDKGAHTVLLQHSVQHVDPWQVHSPFNTYFNYTFILRLSNMSKSLLAQR